ncbi:Hypothetical protein NTJ_09675 [Nesidiocoris tenuis]|uniref:Uncharacterized protein n=1 Tax=Nesidiocoris tenuis TaxID=355587 RepID=A0ABN7B291_9HEMI|nr:Hypothetical protein NTJ_09675 [Nesidiocoris tenuis]
MENIGVFFRYIFPKTKCPILPSLLDILVKFPVILGLIGPRANPTTTVSCRSSCGWESGNPNRRRRENLSKALHQQTDSLFISLLIIEFRLQNQNH